MILIILFGNHKSSLFSALNQINLRHPTLKKTLVMKSEEVIARYFSWQNFLRKARAHIGLSSQ
jgi:hypothetical protein